MKVRRVISYFDKDTEKFLGEININQVDLQSLIEIFKPPKSDPLLYYPYDIDLLKGNKISKLVDVHFDFDKYIYQIDCFQEK